MTPSSLGGSTEPIPFVVLLELLTQVDERRSAEDWYTYAIWRPSYRQIVGLLDVMLRMPTREKLIHGDSEDTLVPFHNLDLAKDYADAVNRLSLDKKATGSAVLDDVRGSWGAFTLCVPSELPDDLEIATLTTPATAEIGRGGVRVHATTSDGIVHDTVLEPESLWQLLLVACPKADQLFWFQRWTEEDMDAAERYWDWGPYRMHGLPAEEHPGRLDTATPGPFWLKATQHEDPEVRERAILMIGRPFGGGNLVAPGEGIEPALAT